jgi:arylsulfatase A-like enzyme
LSLDAGDRTLVIVTSDHGELFGEHGLLDHANSLYAPLLHVPLTMMWPGRIPAGTVIREPVGLRHIGATILDLLRLENTGFPGDSLASSWRGGQPAASVTEPVFSTLEQGIRVEAHWRNSRGRLYSVIVGDRQYIRSSDGSEELYDLASDPVDQVNLAGIADTTMFRAALERFRHDGSTTS